MQFWRLFFFFQPKDLYFRGGLHLVTCDFGLWLLVLSGMKSYGMNLIKRFVLELGV